MYPWLWLWAPQFNFPLSGSLAQNIEPNTSWFSDLIKPPAGDADIEQKAFAVASYGKQLGQITDVLLELAKTVPVTSPEAEKSLASLRDIRTSIEKIKDDRHEAVAARLVSDMRAMRARGGAPYEKIAEQLRPLLAEKTPQRKAQTPRA